MCQTKNKEPAVVPSEQDFGAEVQSPIELNDQELPITDNAIGPGYHIMGEKGAIHITVEIEARA